MEYKINNTELLEFAYELYYKLSKGKDVVFLCVGSDKFIMDSLAPIVAEKLRSKYEIPAIVYGGLGYNINRTNLMEAVNYISAFHQEATIVLIDATLDSSVGVVKLTDGAFAGFGKCLPNRKIGDVAILGVVERPVAKFNLNCTRLKVVVEMAEFIAKGCFLAVNRIKKSCLH